MIGLLQGLSADWDYRPTKEELLEMNDPNQPKPDPPEFDGDPNLIRDMIRQQAQQIMEEEVAALIGAALGENNPERTTWRNGYRARAWKTRAGEVELPIPKLRHGSYFPSFLPPRRLSEAALTSVIQEACVPGDRRATSIAWCKPWA